MAKRIGIVDAINNPDSVSNNSQPVKPKKKAIPKPRPAKENKPRGTTALNDLLQSGEKCNETLQKEEKPMKMTANQIAIVALRGQGLTQSEVAKELKLSKTHVAVTDRKLSPKYSLLSKKKVKAASVVIDNILAGKAREEERTVVTRQGKVEVYKDKVYPPHAVQRATAEMIYQRFEPIEQAAPATAGNTFTQIIINNLPGEKSDIPVIDIAPNSNSNDSK